MLAEELRLPVYVGMRNWKPFMADTIAAMMGDGVERAVVICLAPQNSRTSVGLYRSALKSKAVCLLPSNSSSRGMIIRS